MGRRRHGFVHSILLPAPRPGRRRRAAGWDLALAEAGRLRASPLGRVLPAWVPRKPLALAGGRLWPEPPQAPRRCGSSGDQLSQAVGRWNQLPGPHSSQGAVSGLPGRPPDLAAALGACRLALGPVGCSPGAAEARPHPVERPGRGGRPSRRAALCVNCALQLCPQALEGLPLGWPRVPLLNPLLSVLSLNPVSLVITEEEETED